MPFKVTCEVCGEDYLKVPNRGCPNCKISKDWEEYEENQKLRLKHKEAKILKFQKDEDTPF